MSRSTRQVIIGLLPIQTKEVSALVQHRKCMEMHEHALQHKAHIGSFHSSWFSLICWFSSGIPVSVQTSETPLGGGNFTTRLNLSVWNCRRLDDTWDSSTFCLSRFCYLIDVNIVYVWYMSRVSFFPSNWDKWGWTTLNCPVFDKSVCTPMIFCGVCLSQASVLFAVDCNGIRFI